MSKGKLQRYAAIKTYDNVFEPEILFNFQTDYELKGKWNLEYFKNNNPIVLELGCGKGEYSIGLAEKYPNKNFIGIDIKGARIWRGAKTALETNLKNVAFLRTRIDLLDSYFQENEVSEIWITFPDPQPIKQRKRLTSAFFLNLYQKILIRNGIIHLKTDSKLLHFYTKKILQKNIVIPNVSTDDLYHSHAADDILGIKTHYEKLFLAKGKKITYINFNLPSQNQFVEIDRITNKDVLDE